jgi:hypothetical protein
MAETITTVTIYTIVGVISIIIGQAVSFVVWINKRLQTQRDEFFKLLSTNKEVCNTIKERVGILEVKEDANIKKLESLEVKVDCIESTLHQMKLEAKETELTLLGAINNMMNR